MLCKLLQTNFEVLYSFALHFLRGDGYSKSSSNQEPEEEFTTKRKVRIFGGAKPPKKRKLDNYDHQAGLCMRYEDFDGLDFIDGIAKIM